MQLTNILRDVLEDLGRDRIYLPRDELVANGVSEEMLRQKKLTPEFRKFMIFQVGRARDYYRKAGKMLEYINRDSRFAHTIASTSIPTVMAPITRPVARSVIDMLSCD